jgi:predicted restriction endonuclease
MMNAKTSRPGWAASSLAIVLVLCPWGDPTSSGQSPEKAGDAKSPVVVVESYYKAKWGQADEFLRLYKKNHLPVLKKLKEEGRILRIEAVKPRYHATEDGRWDYRVTRTFRDAAAAHDPAREEAVKQQLYPDQDTLRKEEQRRFEVLDSHWDIVVDSVDLDVN